METKSEMGVISTTQRLMNNIQNCSQLSVHSIAPQDSALNFVYHRKRFFKNPSTVSSIPSHDNISFVYERRKHQRNNTMAIFPAVVSANSSPNGGCSSVIRSENVSVPSCQQTGGMNERETTRVSSIEQPFTTSETIDGYVTEDRGFDIKDKMNKTVELYSVDDSCSSSTLDVDVGLSPLRSKIDDTDECSSSGALVVDLSRDDQSLSVKGICVSILRSHGLLSDSRCNGSGVFEEDAPSCSSSGSRSCNICGVNGTATDMLICDECEEAFHVSCFSPIIRKIPVDDWYCQSCSKKKYNQLKERAIRKSSIIHTEKGSVTSGGELSSIAFMLEDSEPYRSGVRVGKGFQAFVPEWCGPVTREDNIYPEPLELDPSHSIDFQGSFCKPRKAFIGNWLQCREVIVGMGDDIDGTICGKWRRAPLFEVQTDNWDCFRSVFWDPTYADCAASQELETEEVMKQLKYIELLKPRLQAKKRKFEGCKENGSDIPTEDASKCTSSIDVGRNA
ncbi:unnamed protein product [Amaranthus hypochondriacus]